jgi:hypothetical protein
MYRKMNVGFKSREPSSSKQYWSISEISGSHGREYEDDGLPGYCPVFSRKSWPTFQRCLLPPSSEWWVYQARKSYFFSRCFLIALTTEAVSTSDISVSFYETTRRNVRNMPAVCGAMFTRAYLGPYPEPNEFSPHLHTLFLQDQF